jgi:hypothetical protein
MVDLVDFPSETNEYDIDDFQHLSASQVDLFRRGDRVLTHLMELSHRERRLLRLFFDDKLDSKSELYLINLIYEELLTGKHWLMVDEAYKRTLADYGGLSYIFAKIHAAAWMGKLRYCLGRKIYDESLPLGNVDNSEAES